MERVMGLCALRRAPALLILEVLSVALLVALRPFGFSSHIMHSLWKIKNPILSDGILFFTGAPMDKEGWNDILGYLIENTDEIYESLSLLSIIL